MSDVTKDAVKAPNKEAPMKTINAEAFFAPVIAALVATGVSKDGIRSRATAAYWDYLSLCDWVNNGKAMGEWQKESKIRDLKQAWAAKDQETVEFKTRFDQLRARLASIPQEDANYAPAKAAVLEFETKYKASEVEAIGLLKQIKDLEAGK